MYFFHLLGKQMNLSSRDLMLFGILLEVRPTDCYFCFLVCFAKITFCWLLALWRFSCLINEIGRYSKFNLRASFSIWISPSCKRHFLWRLGDYTSRHRPILILRNESAHELCFGWQLLCRFRYCLCPVDFLSGLFRDI